MLKCLITIFCNLFTLAVCAQSPQEGWTFEPEIDDFSADALLDLSYLNEDVAGENGFVQLTSDGEGFKTENGGEIRFWATGGGNLVRDLSDEEARYFAKFLAKRGVNMIRFHGEIHSTTDNINQVNADEVDAIWRMVAVMKEEGIYSTISPYWPNFIDRIPASWELGDYSGTEIKPWALLFFNERYQEAYKNWLTYLYTETNPYTGLALKDDPAVALIQMQNEDGVFFWTIQNVQPSLLATMESQYYDWLIEKYGTIDDAYVAWGGLTLESDQPANSRMGLYIIWEATQPQSGGKDRRLSDQTAFYIDAQSKFYQEVYDHLRTIGCKQLINTTNWKTADAARLLDAERQTNTIGDVMAVNRYYDPGHVGDNNGWRIDPGHQYVGESVLFQPHKLPVNVKQVSGKPFMMTESSWPHPHKYISESVFLTAAYSSLTGFDAYYWFSPRSPGYSDEDQEVLHIWANLPKFEQPIYKFNSATPAHIGPFPANALLYRKGYVQQAPTVVYEERSSEQVQQREVPLITEESGFDPNRDSYDNQGDAAATEIAPVAYLAGKVRVKYNGQPENSSVSPQLNELLNFADKKIQSATGELLWDYDQGQCTLDAPSTQGVTGFFDEGGEAVDLTDISLRVNNDYATIVVVAMDDQPLSNSEKVLVQVNTRYELDGYREKLASFELGDETVEGFEVERTGELPWKAANTEVDLTIANNRLKSAHLLDANGYELHQVAVETADGKLSVALPKETMYVLLNTEASTVTSLNEEIRSELTVYPNPSTGNFTIRIKNAINYFDEVRIHTLIGEEVYRTKRVSPTSVTVDSRLPPGMYIVAFYEKNVAVQSRKVIMRR
jgi:hypothetical protein